MTSYVALLRGINVGGNKTIPMAKLKSLFQRLGLAPAKTHLNSGNVIFAAKERSQTKLARLIGDAIEAEFGFRPVGGAPQRRRAETCRRKKSVWRDGGARPKPPHRNGVRQGDQSRTGSTVSLKPIQDRSRSKSPARMSTSPIRTASGHRNSPTPCFEKHLGVGAGTARNWNTVVKVLGIAEAMQEG